jgi:signal transduction histidine kinase/ligand-binding sensor domain-containing protein
MTPKGLIALLGAALVALAGTSWGQKPPDWPVNWRAYRMADGLPESACVSVALAPQGKVLVRHPKSGSASELDGYTVSVIPAPGAGNGRVYQSPGGQLWAVVADGLQEFKDGHWLLHPVPEIAAEFRARPSRVIDAISLCPARQGVVIFLLPDRLLQFNAEDSDHPRTEALLTAAQTRLEGFSGMTLARDGGLWIAGERGLLKMAGPVRNLKRETEWHDYVPPGPLAIHNFQEPHEEAEGIVTALAEAAENSRKRLVHFDGQHWTTETVSVEGVRHAWCSVDQTCWAVTSNSLSSWPAGRGEAVESEESSVRQYYDVAVEPGGAFWLAASDGLVRYAPLTWRSPAPVREISALVHGLAGDEAGRLWFISGAKLHVLQDDRHREYPLPASIPNNAPAIRALFPLKDGTLFFEAGEQCFRFHSESGAFSAVRHGPPAGPVKPLGLLKDGRLCVQTLRAGAPEQQYSLEAFDGAGFQLLSVPPPDPSPGSSLSILFAAQNGDLWVSGERGTACYHEQKWRTFAATDRSSPESVVGFAELADGKIWCATADKVWAFDGRNWSAVRAGMDRINAFIGSRDGSLWVADESGLHRFFQGAWVENSTEEGLPGGGVREVCEDQRGRIWAGTTRGLSLYHPEADADPPRTYLQPLTGRERNIPAGGTITLTFSGEDKWKYTPRQRLLYSCRLDARDWSPFQEERQVSFTDLPAGKHYFQVRAMDRNCNIDPAPARLEFVVVLPWYKESRLVAIAFAGLAVALFFAGLAFNRHRQLLRSYAEVEQKVAQRTRELEFANRQLLHSQKMNALGTLAAGIAHDFNNILSIVKGSAQIIEDNLDNPQKVRTRVDRIKTVVEQGAGIVKAMLGFSRDSGGQPALCDLNAVLDDTVKLLGDRFLREVQLTLERAPDLPEVPCSKDLVQQVLLNFIFNAAESLTHRKQIILATRLMDKLPASLVLAPAPAARYAAISVRDFGTGISPENLPRIFEPFFTTKALSVRRGTGLGLSMVYELAKKMETGLAVESVVDQGSTFTLILPVREPEASASLNNSMQPQMDTDQEP